MIIDMKKKRYYPLGLYPIDFELRQGGKQETNLYGTDLNSACAGPKGEPRDEVHNPDELTQVSDSGERVQPTQLQLER